MEKDFYKIPDGITKIDKETFIGHESLWAVYIPATVKTIARKIDMPVNIFVPNDFVEPATWDKKGFNFFRLNPDVIVDEEGVFYDKGKQIVLGTIYCDGFDHMGGYVSRENFVDDGINYGDCFTDYNIPDGVEVIGEDAFCQRYYLRNIHIPNTVRSIKSGAFCDCENIEEIHIPESVVSIESAALPLFIKRVTLPEHLLNNDFVDLLSSGVWGYKNADSIHLEKIHITKSNLFQGLFKYPDPVLIHVNEIEVDADCFNYSSIDGILFNKDQTKLLGCPKNRTKECDLPYGIEEIGPGAFEDCDNLLKIHLPNSVTKISERAFKNCVNLKKLFIPDMVATIGKEAFCGCEKIKVVNVPKGLKKIGRDAFWGCEGVIKIFVSDDWEKGNVIQEILGGCPNVKEILVDKSCTKYCSKGGVLFNSKMTKLVSYPTAKSEKEYIVPDGVKTIGKNAFYNADVTKVFIPSSVTTIEPTFIDSHQLSEIIVDKDNPAFSSRDGVLFNKDKTILIHYPQGRKTQEYTVPETVDTIGDFAFNNCGFLKEVTKPASVKQIGVTAFEGCNAQII